MDAVFPTGFPLATGFYLFWLVLTTVIYAFFMHYVFAGTAYIVAAQLAPLQNADGEPDDVLARTLVDWMPAMLGMAITAGIAPLLFLQILYKHQFYTANLLLFHRWMAILPALILAYYMLYLTRLQSFWEWPLWRRLGVILLAFGCFTYNAWAWTDNYLLALDSQYWPEMYVSRSWWYGSAATGPRLAMWLVASGPVLALLAAWQLWTHDRLTGETAGTAALPRLVWIALLGLGLVVVSGGLYLAFLEAPIRAALLSIVSLPYLVVAGLGVAAQAAAWIWMARGGGLTWAGLSAASLGAVLGEAGVIVARETTRLASFSEANLAALQAAHAEAFDKSGLFVFLAFFVINAVVVGIAIYVAASAVASANEPSAPTDDDRVDAAPA